MEDSYEVIQPPFTLKFKEMSKGEIDEYCKWYLEQVPLRIAILRKAVISSAGYESWKADYSPRSLEELGEWFATQVESRELEESEKEERLKGVPERLRQVVLDERQLTNRTYSTAIDVGMYLSQVFLKNAKTLRWECVKTGRRDYVDYGQPVLAGFGVRVFNPVHMMVVFAYGISDHKWTGRRLRQLYDIWVAFI